MADSQDGTVGYHDLRGYLQILDEADLMRHVKVPVDLKWELGAISARGLQVGSPALSFEAINGYEGSVLVTNIMSTPKHVATIFNCEATDEAIYEKVSDGLDHRLASRVVDTGPCKDVVITGDDVDLYAFPTPVWHEFDAAPFILTNGGAITRHPDSGVHNMGMYRMMIIDKDSLTLNNPSSGNEGGYAGRGDLKASDHVRMMLERGETAHVAVALGMDPLLILSSGTAIPPRDGMSEYETAGQWRGAPTELVKCEMSDILVPAHAEMIIEGYVMPTERAKDGPHGESTGFYGETEDIWKVKVTCITHRADPVMTGLICQQIEDYPRTFLRSGSIKYALSQQPGMENVRQAVFPEVGRGGMLIIRADIQDADEPRRIMQAAWDTVNFRWIIVVDDDCDPDDWFDVMWRVCSNVVPGRDVVEGTKRPSSTPGTEKDFTPPENGLGFDATFKFKPELFPPINKVSREIMSNVIRRWGEIIGES